MSPSERLEACLHLLLAEVGAGEAARRYVDSLHRAYVVSPPDDDAVHTFAALERLAVQRVERWLTALRDEGALVTADLEQQARFLVSLVNGLALERALPGARARHTYELSTLKIAVSSVVMTEGTSSP
ncbi:hypothetical protein ACHAAC_08500 [Aeromicrobium sp. CF4.19]|uniref:hypothetical protein n=1 Tax=Aeromicrobium sp. CF4.19 TaxID=3373082 RepID=UPI003EE69552